MFSSGKRLLRFSLSVSKFTKPTPSFQKTTTIPSIIYINNRNLHFLPGSYQNEDHRTSYIKPIKAALTYWNKHGLWELIQEFNQRHELKFGEFYGTLRGVDANGNKYYENLDSQYNRHRWVEYATRQRCGIHATTVEPGWFGWLHYSKAFTPADERFIKPPPWVLRHKENFSGTDKRYLPTNYGVGKVKPKYESWDPHRTMKIKAKQQAILSRRLERLSVDEGSPIGSITQ